MSNQIILADPPFLEQKNPYATSFPNLAILYLISSLTQQLDIDIYYIDGFHSIESHLKKFNEIKPLIYGISFSSSYAAISYHIINKIKESHPHTLVCCGGPHPTADPEGVLKKSQADICCLGEGEETFIEIVSNYLLSKNLENIPGITYKTDRSTLKTNPVRPLIKSIDSIPFPAWDIIDIRKYIGVRKSKSYPSTAIVASRGCPYNCVFCSNPVWKLQQPWLRLRSPHNIAAEVELLYNQGIREIYIRSDQMNSNLDWCINVFNELSMLKHPDLYFQCNLRAKPITNELAVALKKANCWIVHMGVESASQRTLKGINKGILIDNVIRSCKILKNEGIKVYAFMMFYNVWEYCGKLQSESFYDVCKSLTFIIKMRLKGLIDYISWAFPYPYPGSELYRISKKYNLLLSDLNNRPNIMPHEIHLTIPNVSRIQLIFSRAFGLVLQGLFVLFSKEFYTNNNLLKNIKLAYKKLPYIIFILKK